MTMKEPNIIFTLVEEMQHLLERIVQGEGQFSAAHLLRILSKNRLSKEDVVRGR